ncbi:hypothetical protein C725_2744 [Pacificimonas flava]|uniref:Uncharacterized protein n=1 Tax=Pacificimonas flava TaxID=1234595 RepID=M2U233_9SPHN|nr:hypothetical protein C725_2744 [Pacificimonas flava]
MSRYRRRGAARVVRSPVIKGHIEAGIAHLPAPEESAARRRLKKELQIDG